MTTAQQFVAAAVGEANYVEQPVNRTKFAAEAGHPNGYAWCATFEVGIARRVGLALPAGVAGTAYTPAAVAAWKQAGRWHPGAAGIQPGDFAYFQFDSDPQVDHTGICRATPTAAGVPTVEGNTSSSDHGSQANGGQVALRVRSPHLIVGYGRPDFAAAGPASWPPAQEDDLTAIVIPSWVKPTAQHRWPAFRLAVDPGQTQAPFACTVAAYPGAPLAPGLDKIAGATQFRYGSAPGASTVRITGLSSHPEGITEAPDGSIVLLCADGATFGVAVRPAG